MKYLFTDVLQIICEKLNTLPGIKPSSNSYQIRDLEPMHDSYDIVFFFDDSDSYKKDSYKKEIV